MPVIAFHGTADPIDPHDGGGPGYWGYGVEEALRNWARRNNEIQGGAEDRVSESVTKIWYPSRYGTADVVLYRIRGAGHVWPGNDFPFPPARFGVMNGEINATETMLDFFAHQALS